MAIPQFIAPKPPNVPANWPSPADIRDLLSNLFMLLFFYANYYYFVQAYLLRKKYAIYVLLLVVAFATIILVPSLMTGYVPWERPQGGPPGGAFEKPDQNFLISVSHNILLFTSVILFSGLLRFRERLQATEVAKNKAEIEVLRGQVNPHFLFNTLNSLYAMAIRDRSKATAEGIMRLSGLMRYVVTEAGNTQVPLAKELEYIKDYVALQRLRLAENIEFNFQLKGTPGQKRIAPLLIIPFIENAFKHGANPDTPSKISIHLQITEEHLLLDVFNLKVKKQLKDHEQSGHGVANTKARLKLLYPDLHELTVHDEPDHYRVILKINLS